LYRRNNHSLGAEIFLGWFSHDRPWPITPTSVPVIAKKKKQMVNVLHKEHALADRFIARN
jgi:hypothetical protein